MGDILARAVGVSLSDMNEKTFELYKELYQEVEKLRGENEQLKRRCVSNCVQD
ncbi:hypothetical protein [Lederbergia lenta]|uniref:hypothetical protein n=1 Tax=Lederbergia lenta TaxID=1467 RepID=UPI00203C0EA6|nr:hypothetical protein [Lederbergia lenta]MCM3109928.1 hypothetical protein [Lederbergia lenta]